MHPCRLINQMNSFVDSNKTIWVNAFATANPLLEVMSAHTNVIAASSGKTNTEALQLWLQTLPCVFLKPRSEVVVEKSWILFPHKKTLCHLSMHYSWSPYWLHFSHLSTVSLRQSQINCSSHSGLRRPLQTALSSSIVWHSCSMSNKHSGDFWKRVNHCGWQ